MSDVNITDKELNELFAVVETIENGNILVSAVPEIWIDGHIIYWPPGLINRANPTPPQSDWIPHMCKVLKGSIGKPDSQHFFCIKFRTEKKMIARIISIFQFIYKI